MHRSNQFLSYKGAVMSNESDSNGHMNVMYYINKFELGGRNTGVEFGLTSDFMKKNNYGIAVIEQVINYKAEVFEDELLYVMSSAKGYTNKVFHFEHELWSNTRKILSAVMNVKLVILDLEKRKAVSIPDDIKANIDRMLAL